MTLHALTWMLLCCLLAAAGGGARATDSVSVLRALAHEADCVVWGRVRATEAAPHAQLHVVEVQQTIAGDEPPASFLVLTLAGEVADAPALMAGEQAILGLRWATASTPWIQARLGAARAAAIAASGWRLALLGEGKLPEADAALAADAESWIRAVRSAQAAGGSDEGLVALAVHGRAALRAAALAELAAGSGPLQPGLAALARRIAAFSLEGGEDPAGGESWINLCRRRGAAGQESQPEQLAAPPLPDAADTSVNAAARPDEASGPKLAEQILERLDAGPAGRGEDVK